MDCGASAKNLTTPVKGAKIVPNMTVDDLVREYGGCAFGAGRLAEAVDIYYEMHGFRKYNEIFRACGSNDSCRHENYCCRPYP
jgi:deoxyhypusine synthase